MDVLERAREFDWYHSVELGPGLVTDGVVDLRPYVELSQLPERMEGLRVLDVGTWDGFWAFEMERRGAEVVAIDIDRDEDLDWPANRPRGEQEGRRGQGFELAKETLGSAVVRHELSVYDATPDRLGTFDLVFCGSVLIHLRDPVLAIERIAGVCRDRFISVEAYHPWLGLLPFALAHYRALRPASTVFWEPNVRGWKRMLQTGGFSSVENRGRFKLVSREDWQVPHVVLHARK
jgi:tRNA (mo5U34)-methyltransferase